jgi:hypothetical protein
MACALLPHASPDKPLLGEIERVIGRVANFKERAREYYFAVILSPHQCPQCGGRLRMTGQSECSCSCGNIFDPTLAFQKSHCCGSGLLRKTFHYACSRCNRIVPSRFLFAERIFHGAYFREMMRESRKRAKEKREEVRRLLAESRSGVFLLMDDPDIGSIPGLIQDLDEFIGQQRIGADESVFDTTAGFRIEHYREHILSLLSWDTVLFSDIVPLAEDCRRDRTWRFITLVFMENDREVELVQHGNDLVVQRVYNEAHA